MNVASQAVQSLSLSEGLKHAHALEREAQQLLQKAQSQVDASQKALRQSQAMLHRDD